MTGSRRYSLLLLLPLLAGACATPAPAPPQILSLDGRDCAPALRLDLAQPLVIDTKAGAPNIIDGAAACWQHEDGTRSAYLVFQLPASEAPYLVSVDSVPQGSSLFSPLVVLLDSRGLVLRTLPRETFLFRGISLAVVLRVHPAERYLVVASDPPTVGQRISRIAGGTQVSGAMVGTAYVQIHTGYDTTNYLVFAHSGIVQVSALPIPKIN